MIVNPALASAVPGREKVTGASGGAAGSREPRPVPR